MVLITDYGNENWCPAIYQKHSGLPVHYLFYSYIVSLVSTNDNIFTHIASIPNNYAIFVE